MNDTIKFSENILNEIDKKLNNKRFFLRVLDNFIIPFLIIFLLLSSISFLFLYFSGNQIIYYINNKDYLELETNKKDNILDYLHLITVNNLMAIILANIGGVIGIFLIIILSLQLGYLKINKMKLNDHKSIISFIFILILLISIIYIFIVINQLNIPIKIDNVNMKFKYLNTNNKNPFIKFIIFKNGENYDSLLSVNFSGMFNSGNYQIASLSSIICLASVYLLFLGYFASYFFISVKNRKYFDQIVQPVFDIKNADKIKEISKVKEIKNDDVKIPYFIQQQQYFLENKNKHKKIPYNISFTQEIDFNNKESKKIILIETEDKNNIVPNPNKKGLEKIKNKRKIDDLFLKEI